MGWGEGCPATEQKKTSAYIFTPATPLVAPKTVNFAPNRNPTYMSETPFPNLLSFYHCSQSLYECSGALGDTLTSKPNFLVSIGSHVL